MGLPNATSMLSTLPSGVRAVVSRGSVVASYAVRTSISDGGQFSPSGLDRDVRTNVWTLAADFIPKIKVGDLLVVDSINAVVLEAMLSMGNLVNRANVLLFEDTVAVTYNGQTTQALNYASSDDESLSEYGERGLSTGSLRVIASTLAKPDKGATIIVNGKTCLTKSVSSDPRLGLYTIEYQETNPITVGT